MLLILLQSAWSHGWRQSALALVGFKDALSFHRCITFYVYDRRILTKTLHCFVLNGVIFMGSVLLLRYALLPAVAALLGAALPPAAAGRAAAALAGLYSALWLLPAYLLSFLINCLWYSELAEMAVAVAQRSVLQKRADRQGIVGPLPPAPLKVARPDPLTLLGQEVYRALLFAVVCAQVAALRWLPSPLGPALHWALLSWLYALYCFDYKWSLHGVPLEARIAFVESHWAFFLGFGAATVLPMATLPFYAAAAAVGVAFPLFITTACAADPRHAYERLAPGPAAKGGTAVSGSSRQAASPRRRLRIFGPACWLTTAAFGGMGRLPSVGRWLQLRGRKGGSTSGGAGYQGSSRPPS